MGCIAKSSVVISALLVVLSLSSCTKYKDTVLGKDYDGIYHPAERLFLQFEPDSSVVGHITSTDFVGHFSDYVYGHYEYEHPYITIVWERTDPMNDKYTLFPNPDSVLVNDSLDTLDYYEAEHGYSLHKSRTFQPIDKNLPWFDQIIEICYQFFFFIISSILKFVFYIVGLIV